MLYCLVSVVDINDSSNHGLAYAHCYKIEFLVFRERERGGGLLTTSSSLRISYLLCK